MKKLFYIFCTACLALAFTGCEDETNSSLNINDTANKATLTGTVFYDKGYDSATGDVNNIVVAANQTVKVELYRAIYDEYDNDVSSKVKTFTVQTDSEGRYTIELPAFDEYYNIYDYFFEGFYAVVSVNFEGVNYYLDGTKTVSENGIYSGYGINEYDEIEAWLNEKWTTVMNITADFQSLEDPRAED